MTKRKARNFEILRDALRLIVLSGSIMMAAPTLTNAAEKTLLLYGDSLMAGLGLDARDAFAAQLQAGLEERGIAVTIINASVSGDTTADGVERLDWTLADRPDAAIVELGANDMLQGLPASAVGSNLSLILDRFKAENIPVLLAGMKANPSLGASYVSAFDGTFPELSARYGMALFPFFLDGVALESKLNQADGIHPNADGVRIIVANILPYVEQLLKSSGGS